MNATGAHRPARMAGSLRPLQPASVPRAATADGGRSRRSRRLVFVVAVAALGLAAACGGDGEANTKESGSASGPAGASSGAVTCQPVGDIATATSELDVQMTEWSITAPATVKAGKVGVTAKNTGKEVHELSILRVDDPSQLPLKDDGSFDEDKFPQSSIGGEIEEFPVGATCTGVFDLQPGRYTMICNVVGKYTDGTPRSHLAKGMKRPLEVQA
jgi:hypothetical protein